MIAVPDWYRDQGTGSGLGSTGNWPYYTTPTATTNTVYQIWIRQQTIATTTISTQIWNSWSQPPYDGYIYDPRVIQAPRHGYGELARVEAPVLPHDAHVHRARQAARERAEERADELLMSLLSPDQLRQYRAAKAFDVCAKSGRRYRLTRAISGSVKLLGPDGRAAATYCAHLQDTRIPIPDHLIAQKFLIEHHEEEFLRIANRS